MHKTWHILRLGLMSVTAHKLRSALTTLGIILGVASVILMVAIGEGARKTAIDQIRQLGANNIFLDSVEPDDAAATSSTTGRQYGVNLRDVERIRVMVPSIDFVVPSRESRRYVCHDDRAVECRVQAVTPQHARSADLQLRTGRFIGDLDMHDAQPVVVLASHTADELFPLSDPIDASVRIGEDRYFRVIGVFESPGAHRGTGRDYIHQIYIPFSSDLMRFGSAVAFDPSEETLPRSMQIGRLMLSVDDAAHVHETARVLEALLAEYHPAHDVSMIVPLRLLEEAQRTQRTFTLILGTIASISLVVGGIGIMNIMLATVTERTREIGIRRAIGARRGDIVRQFILETIMLATCGGLLGVALGVTIAILVRDVIGVPVLIHPWSAAMALLIAAVTGLVFGAYPAYRAAQMDPIQALRHD